MFVRFSSVTNSGPENRIVRMTGVSSYNMPYALPNQLVIAPGAARRYAPADGSSTRGGSTSVRGRVRSLHTAKLQAASVPTALGERDGRIAVSLNAPPLRWRA